MKFLSILQSDTKSFLQQLTTKSSNRHATFVWLLTSFFVFFNVYYFYTSKDCFANKSLSGFVTSFSVHVRFADVHGK